MPHVHIGFVEFTTTALYVLIFTFLWRALCAALVARDSEKAQALGRALSAIYS